VIHALFHAPIRSEKVVDGRVKPGHDEEPLAVKDHGFWYDMVFDRLT